MMIRHQLQPTENSCGQTVLAMLTDVEARHIVTVMGDGPTTPHKLGGRVTSYLAVRPPARK